MDKLILIFPVLFGVILIAFGWFFVRLGQKMREFDRQIASQGVDVEAVITAHRQEHVDLRNGGGRDTFYITFEYTPKLPARQPAKVTKETQISSADYDRLTPGDTVSVRYLPDKPTDVILLGGVHEQSVPYFFNGGVWAILIGVGLILLCLIVWLR